MADVGIYTVYGIDKTGAKCTRSVEVVSRIAPEEVLQQDPSFQKKCIRYLKLKEKPHKFAIKFERKINAL